MIREGIDTRLGIQYTYKDSSGEDPLHFSWIRIHDFCQRRIRIQGKLEHLIKLEENRATSCFLFTYQSMKKLFIALKKFLISSNHNY